jgi:hypothetical protein
MLAIAFWSFVILRVLVKSGKNKTPWYKTQIIASSFFIWIIAGTFLLLTWFYRYMYIYTISAYNLLTQDKGFNLFNIRSNWSAFKQLFSYSGGMLFHMVSLLLGFYVSEFFFTYHLIICMSVFKATQFVFMAVVENSKMFLVTLLTLVLILIPFSFLQVDYFERDFDLDGGEIEPCNNLW